jgi:hypothetical protein
MNFRDKVWLWLMNRDIVTWCDDDDDDNNGINVAKKGQWHPSTKNNSEDKII